MNDELTVQQAAQMAGVSRQTVYNWIKANKVKTYGVHGATRIDRGSFDEHVSSKPVVGQPSASTSGTDAIEATTGL